MNILKIAELTNGKILSEGEKGCAFTEFYAGDFLSRVMSRAPSGGCWLTIMNGINVAGVAVLAEIKLIVFCEGVIPSAELVEKCREEKVGIITTEQTVFECCKCLA